MHETASSPPSLAKKDPAQNVNSDEDGTGKLSGKAKENVRNIMDDKSDKTRVLVIFTSLLSD